MARTFYGSSASLSCTIGGCTGIAGPYTLVSLCKKTTDTAAYMDIWGIRNASQYVLSIGVQNDDRFYLAKGTAYADRSCNIMLTGAEGWCLLAATKGAGTVTPRFHQYVYGTNTWTHEDGSGTLADNTAPGASGTVRFGNGMNGFGAFSQALNAVFAAALTDTEIERLPYSLPAWYSLSPVGLWLLDQSLTTQGVADLTGLGANQSAITGTTIATTHPPVFSRGAPVLAVTREAAVVAARFRRTDFPRTGSRGAYGGS